MLSKLCVLGLAVACANGVATRGASQKMFDDFVAKYYKAYTSQDEYNHRLQVFRDNLVVAEQLTAAGGSVHGVTKFSDLTAAEFKTLYTGYKPSATKLADATVAAPEAGAPPANVDWRQKGKVTPVKNQGQCGSCWAFSTVEEIESDWLMAGNAMVELSPQQIVDCDKVDQGCNGGNTNTAYNYVKSVAGLETEADYPYTSGIDALSVGSGKGCQYNAKDAAVGITGFSWGAPQGGSDETTFQSNLATKGPMSICVATGGWQTYTSGTLTKATCGSSVDHCVQAVGYNTAGKYWIVRNSWATDWGIQGYIYVELGTNACMIAGDVTFASTKKA